MVFKQYCNNTATHCNTQQHTWQKYSSSLIGTVNGLQTPQYLVVLEELQTPPLSRVILPLQFPHVRIPPLHLHHNPRALSTGLQVTKRDNCHVWFGVEKVWWSNLKKYSRIVFVLGNKQNHVQRRQKPYCDILETKIIVESNYEPKKIGCTQGPWGAWDLGIFRIFLKALLLLLWLTIQKHSQIKEK